MSRDRWGQLGAIAIVVALLMLTAAVPGLVALFCGFAWGLLAALAVGAVIYRLAGQFGMDGGFEVLFFGIFAVVIGLIVGTIWRLLT